MEENVANLVKEINIEVQETQSPKQDGRKADHNKIYNN